MSPSFRRSARAESKIDSGILTSILPFNSFVKNECLYELSFPSSTAMFFTPRRKKKLRICSIGKKEVKNFQGAKALRLHFTTCSGFCDQKWKINIPKGRLTSFLEK